MFSIWLPFLITSFSLGEEKAEVFQFRDLYSERHEKTELQESAVSFRRADCRQARTSLTGFLGSVTVGIDSFSIERISGSPYK